MIDTGAASFIEHSGDVFEIERGRGGDVKQAVGAASQDLFEAIGQIVPGDRFGVDVEGAVGMNADHDFARRRWWLAAVGGRLRDARVEAGGLLRKDHHKDDEENEQDVDQRSHVDFGLLSRCHCHAGLDTGGGRKFRRYTSLPYTVDMRTAVVSLPGYEKEIIKLLTVDERRSLENHLAENPGINPVIAGTSGVRKARWSSGGSGKSGGIRVIYYFMRHRGVIYRMAAYAKSTQTTLTAADKKMLKHLVAEIKSV